MTTPQGPMQQPPDPLTEMEEQDAAARRLRYHLPSKKRGPYKKRLIPTEAHVRNAMKQLSRPEMKSHTKRRDGISL